MTSQKIISELLKSWENPNIKEQEQGTKKAISNYLDITDDQTGFLLTVRDCLIDWISQDIETKK